MMTPTPVPQDPTTDEDVDWLEMYMESAGDGEDEDSIIQGIAGSFEISEEEVLTNLAVCARKKAPEYTDTARQLLLDKAAAWEDKVSQRETDPNDTDELVEQVAQEAKDARLLARLAPVRPRSRSPTPRALDPPAAQPTLPKGPPAGLLPAAVASQQQQLSRQCIARDVVQVSRKADFQCPL